MLNHIEPLSALSACVWLYTATCTRQVTAYEEFQETLPATDPWDPLVPMPETAYQEAAQKDIKGTFTNGSGYAMPMATQKPAIHDGYSFDWASNDSTAKPIMTAPRKRQRSAVEKPFALADQKASSHKRARKDAPVFVPTPDKENLSIPTAKNHAAHLSVRSVETPLNVYQHKGINEISLLINGESIETLCGAPVYLPDFAQTVASNLHISKDRDSLGCLKFNRKPTDTNVQNILKMVRAKFQGSYYPIADGSAQDDAVVFDRVKQVAKVLSGSGLETFIDRVFFQTAEEYLENGTSHRDYLENAHYRYFTRHMWFEVQLLEVLRQHYPRQGGFLRNVRARPTESALYPEGTESDAYNIREQLDSARPRSAFQEDLIAVLEAHLKKLPDPARLPSKAAQRKETSLATTIAHAMYSHAHCIEQQNIVELAELAQRSLGKRFCRLDALHIVQQLAFRYTFNARYLLFQEHSGKIVMNSREHGTFTANIDAILSMLNAERKFTAEVPAMFGEMIQFIARSGANTRRSGPTVKRIENEY